MITVRNATSADLPELTRLWHEKTVIQQQFDRRFILLPDSASRWVAVAETWLTLDDYAVIVAARDTTLLGYAVGCIQSAPPGLSPQQVGVVLDMAVDPHGHQGGLGKFLLTALREWFRARDVTVILAHVPHRAAVEQAFWRAQGAVDWIDLLWMK